MEHIHIARDCLAFFFTREDGKAVGRLAGRYSEPDARKIYSLLFIIYGTRPMLGRDKRNQWILHAAHISSISSCCSPARIRARP